VDEFDTETEDLALTTDIVELLRGRMAELERRFGMVSKRNGELLDLCNAKDRRIVELETRLAHAERQQEA
jgi:BMFP domain-containing protein YqiC